MTSASTSTGLRPLCIISAYSIIECLFASTLFPDFWGGTIGRGNKFWVVGTCFCVLSVCLVDVLFSNDCTYYCLYSSVADSQNDQNKVVYLFSVHTLPVCSIYIERRTKWSHIDSCPPLIDSTCNKSTWSVTLIVRPSLATVDKLKFSSIMIIMLNTISGEHILPKETIRFCVCTFDDKPCQVSHKSTRNVYTLFICLFHVL